MRVITTTIVLIALLFAAPFVQGKEIAPTTSSNYAQALETANAFLWAWSTRNVNLGIKLISHRLLLKLKKEDNESWFRQYMSGLSDPHHLSFEIGKGKITNSKRAVFPVVLYEYYYGGKRAFKYTSKIVVVKDGASWRVDVLPKSSDTE